MEERDFSFHILINKVQEYPFFTNLDLLQCINSFNHVV